MARCDRPIAQRRSFNDCWRSRRQPLQAVAVDLATLIDGMASLIGSTVGPNIDVRVELADDEARRERQGTLEAARQALTPP